jgi:cytochrome b6-f complex iron-sulfur subunit
MDQQEERSLPRRQVFRYVLDSLLAGGVTALFATLLYPVFRFVMPPSLPESEETSATVGKTGDFPPNSGKVVRFGSKPLIVVRTPGGELRAFSAVCTHLQCIVQYRPDLEHIWCACHNGHFDLFGRNIAGPPPRPLEQYTVAVRGEDIVVTRNV